MHPVRVGTCGWSYKEWSGVFYPKGLTAVGGRSGASRTGFPSRASSDCSRGPGSCRSVLLRERGRQVAHAPGQPAHWPNRGRVGSMRDLGTWSTQERTSTSRSVSAKARMWRFTP